MKYPREFRKEIWNAPRWMMKRGVSLSSGKAAEFLGMDRSTLVIHADALGLTVIRRPADRHIFFLISELEELRERLHRLTYGDVIESINDDDFAVLPVGKPRRRR